VNYRPKDMLMWDAWYWNTGDEIHAFHLQQAAPGSAKTVKEIHSIGHAVSKDLIRWEERPLALSPGEPGALDDMEIFTGCTYEKDGLYYLFYTMKSSREQGAVQRIAVATSTDLEHWKKYPENPVLTPDPRWYHTASSPALYGLVDCRDLCIVKDPDGEGYYGFYAARVPAEEMPEGAVIACCYSKDLIHWEQRGPAFESKGKYTIVEVPTVVHLDGKWYMLLLCNNEYGNRDLFPGQPQLTMGTIYAVSDWVDGPYTEPEENILLASQTFNGISCRTVEFQGKQMLMYTSASRTGASDAGDNMMGVLSTPKELIAKNGRLYAKYSPLIETALGEKVLDEALLDKPVECRLMYQTPGQWKLENGKVYGSVRTAWARYTFPARARSFIYNAKVTVNKGVGAGLAFKEADHGYGGGIFMLDYEKGMVQLLRIPQLNVVDSRKADLKYGQTYSLKVISKDKYLEFYLDGMLIMQCVFYAAREGLMGLVVDRGEAVFEDIDACLLKDCPEED